MKGTLPEYIEQNRVDASTLRSALLQAWISRHRLDGVKFKAAFLKKEAGDDIHKKTEAVEIICETLNSISLPVLQDEYIKIVAAELDVKVATLTRKIRSDREEKTTKDIKKIGEELKRVRFVAEQVERSEIDMTTAEGDLQIIADALASLGESARDYFHRICSQRPEYLRSQLDPVFTEALKKGRLKNASRFFKLADIYGLKIKVPKTIAEAKEQKTAQDIIGDKELSEEFMEFGIYEEDGVYKSVDQWNNAYVVSNFTMKILWHVETSDDTAYRLVAIKNVYGYKAVINMNTDNFVSVGSFKKEVARKGNYLWKGNDIDLTRLQDKLQRDEKPTELVKHLGWHKRGKFYAFANGIYEVAGDVFLPVDEYGIVQHEAAGADGEVKLRNYFIPAMSKIYADKDDKFSNDKKFIYKPSENTFEKWSKQFCKVYGYQGELTLVFYIMCLFSDIIFQDLTRRFPMLFLYGKRGSGKGSLAQSIMRLFGQGQDQIMLGGSSTAVGFMRKFAQFINAIVWLDEYKNNLPSKIIESIKNIFDRIGYERGKKDNTFDTESTPIYSGCILSGQEMPTIEPALFTRGILTSLTETKRTEEQRVNMRELERMEEGGLSGITVSLMKFRPLFAEKFRETFYAAQKTLIHSVNNNEVDERMYVNYSAMIAAAELIDPVMPLPFNLNGFKDLMKRNLLEQFFVLKGSDDASKFWDVVEGLFNRGYILEDKHFILKNGYLYIRVGDIYQTYAEELIKRRDPNVLDKETLYKYLESDTKTFVNKKKKWFSGQGQQLWCHAFKYSELNINLIKGNDQEELRRKYKAMNMNFEDEQQEMDFPKKTDEDDGDVGF
jgi:hypothetical protein